MKRRIVVREPSGGIVATDIYGKPTPHFEIDMSDRPNVNVSCLYVIEVQEQCNLGHFHTVQSLITQPWEDNDWKKKEGK